MAFLKYYSLSGDNRQELECLGDYFTPTGMEIVKKDKRLDWPVKPNAVRQRYSHPQRDIMTEEEHNFLSELAGWLTNKLCLMQ